MDKPKHYTTLEGMRGIGAIYVVLAHGEQLYGAAAPRSASLGVDFFFVLSGFIVAHVYAGPLDRGLSTLSFLKSRLLRLYPIYMVGILSGVAVAALSVAVGHDTNLWSYTQPFISLPFAMLLLPSPASDAMFPLDIPAWSLFVEAIVSVAIAFRFFRSTAALLATMAIAGTVLAVALATQGDLNVGWSKQTAIFGLARIGFSFPLGMLIHRFKDELRVPSWFYVVPMVVLAAVVYADPSGPLRVVFNVVFICAIGPALVLAGAATNPASAWLNRLFITLGALSYPLYALHYPILMAAEGSISRHVPPGALTTLAGIILLVVLVLLAHGIAGLDARLRSSINRRRHPARIAAAGPASPPRNRSGGAQRRAVRT